MIKLLLPLVLLCLSLTSCEQSQNDINDLRQAAELGDAKAQSNLGVAYYYGEGVAENTAEALKWLSKAAEQGYAKAQYNLEIGRASCRERV